MPDEMYQGILNQNRGILIAGLIKKNGQRK
jgi:hypothetical protein